MADQILPWMKEYPTVADVAKAAAVTLAAWDQHLPAPQTDVQRTVRARISRQLATLTREELQNKHPDLLKRFDDILDSLAKAGLGKRPF
jgi:hypothetical protein